MNKRPFNKHRKQSHQNFHTQNKRHQDEPLGQIPSPYNFVTVEDRIAPADTPERVSHDLPFQDGLSGYLDLEIEATTPIYTRAAGDFKSYRQNHGNQDSEFARDCQAIIGQSNSQPGKNTPWRSYAKFTAYTDFYRLPDGRAALPGTSLRGPIRNLIEILTNSRLGPVNERRYAVRDLNNPDRTLYGGWMSHNDSGVFEPKVHAGWLREEDGQWTITPCEFARVEQADLETFAGRPNLLGARGGLERKYEDWAGAGQKLEMLWRIGPLDDHTHSGGKRLRYRLASPVTSGGTPGTLVFTGQPMARVPGKSGRKHLEFVFFNPSPASIPVPPKARKDFLETHTDEQGEPSDSWKYWRSRLAQGVPVFYLAYKSATEAGPDRPTVSLDTPGAHLHAFGLAMMFRLAYRHTLREAVPPAHRKAPAEGEMDFTEAIFGYQREGRDEGLRGRVTFGPCVAEGLPVQLPPVITVLSAPKPTYYPNYLEQPFDPANGNKLANGETYKTLMAGDARLRGWKFYPAHPDGPNPVPPLPPENNQGGRSYKTATAFRPLAAGTKFRGRMRFHNLRPADLGALLWALTWGGNENLRHRLGMAKPLGCGCAKIRLLSGRLIPNDPAQPALKWEENTPRPALLDNALAAFEQKFAARLQSPEIRDDLLGMANPNHGQNLCYPKIAPHNQFADAKKQRLVLPRWRFHARKPAGKPRVDKAPPAEAARPQPAGHNPAPQAPRPGSPPPPPPVLKLPALRIGEIIEGRLILQPGVENPTRLYFEPGGHPELAGNTGVKLDNDRGAAPGQRWKAKVKSSHLPTFFELLERLG